MSLMAKFRQPGPLVTVSLAYFAAVSGFMIWRGISVSPDYILLILVPVALLSGRFLGYLRDWVPFIAIFLAWEAMRGIAPEAGIAPHVRGLVQADSGLFAGHLPTAVMQQAAAGVGWETPLAYIATVIYFCHFVFPLAVGMVLWLRSRTAYLRFVTALLGMSLLAFVIFLLFPTAPPWYAEQQGVASGFVKLISQTLPSAVSPYYQSLNPNKVAAFPSLHAAFPFLGFLALRGLYPRASLLALVWSVLVWGSVVFLGEHYVVDVIGGVILATGCWLGMQRFVFPRIALLQEGKGQGKTMAPVPEAAVV